MFIFLNSQPFFIGVKKTLKKIKNMLTVQKYYNFWYVNFWNVIANKYLENR